MNMVNQQQPGNNYYGYNNYPPYPQYQRPSIEQSYYPMPTGSFLKGRPVASLEEARAAQIDFDGSLYVFTDIGNKKIYTKQINLDGTATLNTYTLVQDAEAPTAAVQAVDYVTREEFVQALSQIQASIDAKREEKPATLKF